MIEGESSQLRAIERDDLPTLLEWRNDPSLRRYFREYRELTLDDQVAWFERSVLDDERTIMFAIHTDRLVGATGLCNVDWVSRSGELSIYLGGSYVDDLVAPDAARTLLSYGFDSLGLHRVWGEVYEFDHPKQGLFAALGFTHEGTLREKQFHEGTWHGSRIYGLLQGEFTDAARSASTS